MQVTVNIGDATYTVEKSEDFMGNPLYCYNGRWFTCGEDLIAYLSEESK